MFSPLLETIIEREEIPVVGQADLAALCAQHDLVVLMVAGDYKRVTTSNDLAVIFPELVKAFDHRFKPCISTREDEGAFQAAYGFVQLPTLVFIKDGTHIGNIIGIHDWADFIEKISKLLSGSAPCAAAQ